MKRGRQVYHSVYCTVLLAGIVGLRGLRPPRFRQFEPASIMGKFVVIFGDRGKIKLMQLPAAGNDPRHSLALTRNRDVIDAFIFPYPDLCSFNISATNFLFFFFWLFFDFLRSPYCVLAVRKSPSLKQEMGVQ